MPEEETFRFKKAVPAADRRRQADAQMQANPEFVTVVCEASPGEACSRLRNPLLVVPGSATVAGLAALLKEQLGTSRRMTVTVRGRPCYADNELGSLHQLYKDPEDHILYVRYATLEVPPPTPAMQYALVTVVLGGVIAAVWLLARRRRGSG